jgi:type IV pilus biogenesis protein CpaD/CtpE
MRRIRQMMFLATALATAGCTTDTGFGNAVRQNMAAQIIDPDPSYRGTPVEAGSGDRAALALRRYRQGRVIDPRPASGAAPFQVGNQGGAGAGAGMGGGGNPPR